MPANLDILHSATRAAPGLAPSTYLAIAQSGSDEGDAIDAAQATQAMGQTLTSVNGLKELEGDQQNSYWDALSEDQRDMYKAMGYQGPPGKSIWGRTKSGLSSVGHGIAATNRFVTAGALNPIRGLEETAKSVGKAALDASAYGTKQMQNAYRADQALVGGATIQNADGTTSSVAPSQSHTATMLSPSAWAKAFNATRNGEQTYNTGMYNNIQQAWDGHTVKIGNEDVPIFDLAVAAQSGQIEDWTKKKFHDNPQAIADVVNAVNQNEDVKSVSEELGHNKLSFGRTLTPDSLWKAHPKFAWASSGTLDAIFDIKTDPTLAAGKARKAYQAARYGVRTEEDLSRVMATKQGDRYLKNITKDLNAENYAAVVRRFPSLASAVPDMARQGIKTPADLLEAMKMPMGNVKEEDVHRWMKNNFTALRMAIGDGVAPGKDAILAPHMSWLEEKQLAAKDYLTKKIDWASSVAIPDTALTPGVANAALKPLTIAAKGVQRIATLLPEGREFDPNGPEAVTFVQRFADTYLSREAADHVVNTWAKAGYDTAAKKLIFGNMLHQVFEAGGLYKTEEGRKIVARWMSVSEEGILRQSYGVNDKVIRDGVEMPRGIWEHQLTEMWSVPSFKQLQTGTQRDVLSKIVYGVTNNMLANSFNALWKPAQLLRFGFPIRVSLDELAGGLLRNGLTETVQARMGGAVARTFKEYADELDIDHKTLASVDDAKRQSEELNEQILKLRTRLAGTDVSSLNSKQLVSHYQREEQLKKLRQLSRKTDRTIALSPLNIMAAHATQQVKLAFAKTGEFALKHPLATIVPDSNKLTSAETYEAIKFGIDNGTLDKAFAEHVSATHGAQYLGANEDATQRLLVDGIKPIKVYFRKGDGYRDYEPGNDYFNRIWRYRLGDLKQSSAAKVLLDNYDDPNVVPKLADYLESSDWAANWQRGARGIEFGDNKVVGENATRREAAEAWAQTMKDTADAYVTGADGTVHRHLMDAIKNGDDIDLKMLDDIADEARPAVVSGPEQVPIAIGGIGGAIKNFSDHSFHYIGKSIDWMARQPLFLHNYAAAYKELRPRVVGALGEGPAADQVLKELVSQRAVKNTAQFIHNPELKSQMNTITANFLPFQFAQEQFYKRWTRTFLHSPEAIRKAQLSANALSTSGVVHEDGMGNKVFSYPATGWAQQTIGQGLQTLGFNVKMPVNGGFSGELKMVAPGLDRTFSPSFGPVLTFPISQVGRFFPELKPTTDALLGPIGSSRSIWEQILPATLTRMVHLFDNPATSDTYASAMNKTIQDIAASKYDDKDPGAVEKFYAELNSDPAKQQDFIDQVKNGTRVNVALRMVLGFTAPAAPSMEIGDTVFGERMKQLQSMGLDFTTAQQQLLRTNPELTPYSVFQSQGAGSEPLPSTVDSLKSLNDNQEFFMDHPQAGGFFLPNAPTDSTFNAEAYRLQMAYEMRTRRTPKEFLEKLLYNEAANDYYDTRDAYLAANKNAPSAIKQQNTKQWTDFKTQFDKMHPVFADQRNQKTSAVKRAQTLRDVQLAFDDPRAPKNKQTEVMRNLVDTYQAYLDADQSWAGQTNSYAVAKRKQNKEQMKSFAKKYVQPDQHPEAKPLYLSLMKPDLEGSE